MQHHESLRITPICDLSWPVHKSALSVVRHQLQSGRDVLEQGGTLPWTLHVTHDGGVLVAKK